MRLATVKLKPKFKKIDFYTESDSDEIILPEDAWWSEVLKEINDYCSKNNLKVVSAYAPNPNSHVFVFESR